MRIFRFAILLFLLFLLCRGPIYRNIIHYHEIAERPGISLTNDDLLAQLDTDLKSLSEMINMAKRATTKRLKFTTGDASRNPNSIYVTGQANCIGYAALFNAIANQLIINQGWEGRYVARHLVGKMDFLGWDLHQIIDHPFFRDHDFNVIIDLETGEKIYIDATVSDYLWIDRVNGRSN